MKFLAELKRRNVIRMAGLYLVVAWLIVQVAGTILPMFGAPEWVARTVVILLAIGFIPALVVSWAFQLTPEGLKREDEVGQAQSIAPNTAQRMDRMLLVIMTLALAYFAFDKFVWAPTQVATAAAAISGSPAEPAADEAQVIVRGIAVLPFDNLSPDPDNAFFAGGVYEEVLTKLSRIGELRVISRTSMERIAEDKLQVGEIGARLGVSHVLEGSVRRADDQIRVTVQLIEAASDAQIWAENYDRKLDDVFAIQSEIAIAIADQLKLTLSPELQADLSERPTQNQAAYALYLRALEERNTWRGTEGFKAIIDLLEPAVAADPDFLQAQVLLAEAYGRMNWTNSDPDGSYADKARKAVAAIVQRWPDHPQSQIAQGQLLYNLERDYASALTHFQAAREQLPGDIELLNSISFSLKQLGRHEAYLEAARRAVELDPESNVALDELALALLHNGHLDEAIATAERALKQNPANQNVPFVLMQAKLARDGDLDAALAFAPDSSQGLIARFVKGDIDALLPPGSAALQPLQPRQGLTIRLLRVELLRLAGRDTAAQALLEASALNIAEKLALLANPSTSSYQRSMTHSHLANWAALSGKPAQAREHVARKRLQTHQAISAARVSSIGDCRRPSGPWATPKPPGCLSSPTLGFRPI